LLLLLLLLPRQQQRAQRLAPNVEALQANGAVEAAAAAAALSPPLRAAELRHGAH
jgi:hypothetical protein